LPDLFVSNVDWGSDEDRGVLVFTVRVTNAGDAPSPSTVVQVSSGLGAAVAVVRGLDASENDEVTLEMRFGDDDRDRSHRFRLVVDPQNDVAESNEGNNRATEDIDIPPWEAPKGDTGWGPVVILGIAGAAAAAGTAQRTIRTRNNKKWQNESEENERLDECSPESRFCFRGKPERKLAKSKVTYLGVATSESSPRQQRRQTRLRGAVVERLNAAIKNYGRRGEVDEAQVARIADEVLTQILGWLPGGPAPQDVSIIAHLVGREGTTQFTMYRCKNNRWQKERKWKVTVKEEVDEPVDTLASVDPAEAQPKARIAPQLSLALIRFIPHAAT
jgi:hypothetical protein